MPRTLRILLLLLLTPVLYAGHGLPDVLKARQLLGEKTWSSILHLVRRNGSGLQPKDFFALAFEFNRMIWLYCPFEGTRNLSTQRGHSEEDKALVLDLSRREWSDTLLAYQVTDKEAQGQPAEGAPSNGCFVQSAVAWQQVEPFLGSESKGSLFSYYWQERTQRGHTVLLLNAEKESYVIDLTHPTKKIRPVDPSLASNALALAQFLEPELDILKARLDPVTAPSGPGIQPKGNFDFRFSIGY